MASLRSTEENLKNRELSKLGAGGRERGSDACSGFSRRRKRGYVALGKALLPLFPKNRFPPLRAV